METLRTLCLIRNTKSGTTKLVELKGADIRYQDQSSFTASIWIKEHQLTIAMKEGREEGRKGGSVVQCDEESANTTDTISNHERSTDEGGISNHSSRFIISDEMRRQQYAAFETIAKNGVNDSKSNETASISAIIRTRQEEAYGKLLHYRRNSSDIEFDSSRGNSYSTGLYQSENDNQSEHEIGGLSTSTCHLDIASSQIESSSESDDQFETTEVHLRCQPGAFAVNGMLNNVEDTASDNSRDNVGGDLVNHSSSDYANILRPLRNAIISSQTRALDNTNQSVITHSRLEYNVNPPTVASLESRFVVGPEVMPVAEPVDIEAERARIYEEAKRAVQAEMQHEHSRRLNGTLEVNDTSGLQRYEDSRHVETRRFYMNRKNIFRVVCIVLVAVFISIYFAFFVKENDKVTSQKWSHRITARFPQSLRGDSSSNKGVNINGTTFYGYSLSLTTIQEYGLKADIVAVGSPGMDDNKGGVFVYKSYRNSIEIVPFGQYPLHGADEIYESNSTGFGYSVALSEDLQMFVGSLEFDDKSLLSIKRDCDQAVDLSVYKSSVDIFKYDSIIGGWISKSSSLLGIQEGDGFGASIDFSDFSGRLIVGSPFYDMISHNDNNTNTISNSGRISIFSYNNDAWEPFGSDIIGVQNNDYYGSSVSISGDGNTIAFGALQPVPWPCDFNDNHGKGKVIIYSFDVVIKNWIFVQEISAEHPTDFFGCSVSLSFDGNRLAVGAFGNDGAANDSGHTRVYERRRNDPSSEWIQIGGDLDGSSGRDYSGWSTSLSNDGSSLAFGSPKNDYYGDESGQVKIFDQNSSQSSESTRDDYSIYGQNKGENFGFSVALSGDGERLVAGSVNGESITLVGRYSDPQSSNSA